MKWITIFSLLLNVSVSLAVEVQDIKPLSVRSEWRDIFHKTDFSNADEMRKDRRVAIATQLGGATGQYGIGVNLFFNPESAFVASFGGSDSYRGFHFGGQYLWNEKSFSAYHRLGYSHWYNSQNSGSVGSSELPSSSLLTKNERESGQFSVNLAVAGLGLQYLVLKGPYAGTAVFIEAIGLSNVRDFSFATTGSAGLLYHF
ncbi:MAG: hypothetical protein LW875_02540 [Proteobacteria bacterium]|jgi:hypothetical protein|nr:hypothetical protein [Pseudomonadota bacterium]